MQRLIILLITSFFLPVAVHAQTALIYNINKYNGLATNHIYVTHVDKLGYLWIGTNKGVYRYNGYTMKKYDYSNGLATTDVWAFFEDEQKRLWLQGISNEFGYIKNGFYHAIKTGPIPDISEIYPRGLQTYNGELVYVQQNYPGFSVIMRVKNDSLTHSRRVQSIPKTYNAFTTFLDTFYFEIYHDTIVRYPANSVLRDKDQKNNYRKIIVPDTPAIAVQNLAYPISGIYCQQYFFCCRFRDTAVYFHNLIQNKAGSVQLTDNELVIHAYPNGDKFFIISDKSIYTIDKNLNSTKKSLRGIVPQVAGAPESITYFQNHNIWGESLVSTNNKGLYINYSSNATFAPYFTLDSFIFCGSDGNGGGLWWREEKHLLIQVVDGEIIHSYRLPKIKKVTKASIVSDTKIFLNTHEHRSYWLNTNTGELSPIANKLSVFPFDGSKPFYIRDYDFEDSNKIYYSSSHQGLMSMYISNDYAQLDSVYFDRFHNIYFNKKNKILIGYSDDKIVFINTKNKKTWGVSHKELRLKNVRGIEKIVMDDYGNTYIKEHNKLFLYNHENGNIHRLIDNLILTDAVVDIIDNTVFVAGSFGALEIEAIGKEKAHLSQVYPNTKNILYSYVKHAQFSHKSIMLVTDKGNFIIHKQKTRSTGFNPDNFRIVLTADSFQSILRANDTITLSQSSVTVDVDVIKPTGTGTLNIEYSVNGEAYQNTGYQIILPKSSAGKYYNISLIAFDNNWKSEPVSYTIFIRPNWWQTKTAKNWFIAGTIILLIGLGYIVFIVTRHLVNKTNERKNRRRELELKSIYSQINPHFIFNSLSTALYFVRKNKNKEAFDHISQFSQLLRSYIKSSRNKYITITEELENLNNYLELQLTRFENKFKYSFNIADNINPDNIKIPSLLLQPLVENALNHGIFHKEDKGLLSISFCLENEQLLCIVDDNGIGRKKSKEAKNAIIRKADSYGSILIDELINTFNKYEKINITIEYIDKEEPEPGTTVIIRIANYDKV